MACLFYTSSAASNFLTKQDYDLIVLDVNLPDGHGFAFCREVKERRPDTAVIFLTANDMESDMLKGYELAAEDYVTKPFPMSVFQKKLSVVLGLLSLIHISYEYHAEKLRKIADKLQAGIGYDYDKAVERRCV